MNIISTRRAIRALDDKIWKLEGCRERAKDKPKWETTGGVKLAVARSQVAALRKALMLALTAQGYFSHSSQGKARGEHHGE